MDKIILIIPNSNLLGDNIVITPHIKFLSKKNPKLKVTVLANGIAEQVFGLFNIEIIKHDINHDIDKIILSLQNKEIISIYNFSYKIESYLLIKNLKCNESFGYESLDVDMLKCIEIYTSYVPIDFWTPNNRDRSCIDTLGSIIKLKYAEYLPKMPKLKLHKAFIDDFIKVNLPDDLNKKRGVISFFPGGGSKYKRWGIEKFISICKELQERYLCVFVFGPNEKTVYEEYISMKTSLNALTFTNINIKQLAALYSISLLNITNDSGPMHISCSIGCPTIAIFGTTNSKAWFPYDKRIHRVVEKNCASYSNCNNCRTQDQCIQSIEESDVTKKINEILN